MHILVTGGAGFIGSALVDRLLAEGHTVDVVDDLSTGSLVNLAEARAGAGRALSFHQLDVRSPETAELVARRNPEVVVHLATRRAGRALAGQAADAQVNVVGTLAVVEAAAAAGATKVVVASTAGVYGDRRGQPAATESTPRRPGTPEAIAAHAIDSYLGAFARSDGLVFTSLVLATVYGPRDSAGLVADWARRLASAGTCTGDPAGELDLVFVDDVVDAFARALTGGGGMFVNVGTGTATSLASLHAALGAAVGVIEPAQLRTAVHRGGELHDAVLNPGRAAEVLGWSPWTSLAEGLAAVVAASGA